MTTAVLWFRRDLRLRDNPAVHAVAANHSKLVCVYIHAPDEEAPWEPGAASRWWLHNSLDALRRELKPFGQELILLRGPTREALLSLARATGARDVYFNHRYEPNVAQRDAALVDPLSESGIALHGTHGNVLFEPASVLNKNGTAYKVFTPFWNELQTRGLPSETSSPPRRLPPPLPDVRGVSLDALGLMPRKTWYTGLARAWSPGERSAEQRAQRFVETAMQDYPTQRDVPSRNGTSRLSPHLHFGEISPRRIVAMVNHVATIESTEGTLRAADAILRELAWREFAIAVLHHYPITADQPMNAGYADFPWAGDGGITFARWQRGVTGVPIIDAGMRELWATGWMHNRVRMLVASFLTKHCLIDWRLGARWFWDTLVDADLANNSFNWQWAAGCGADAAPYFRIFNPVTQSEKFDPRGIYLRKWLPELQRLPDRWIHQPWIAPATVLREAGIVLDRDYPTPVVDLKAARERALEAFAHWRKGRSAI